MAGYSKESIASCCKNARTNRARCGLALLYIRWVGQSVVVEMWHHMRVKHVITVTNAIAITMTNVQA